MLATKLEVPPLPTMWAERERLDRLLTQAVEHRLTVVTGPPGSGKSVTLAGWAARHVDRRVAWVSLDQADNEGDGLWRALGASLDECGRVGRERGRPRGRGGATGATPATLLGRAPALPPCVLVLDDFHALRDKTVVADLAYVVRNLPRHVHVVVSGRDDPRLPLHRLRAGGDLAEVRQRDLCFTAEEAGTFLQKVAGRHLAEDDVRALAERTEGWAVGLQLAGTMLREEPDPSDFVRRFTGSAQLVAEYLLGEVLDTLPDDLVEFLLLTSVLDQLSPSLCARVTGRADAERVLDELVARHLFVSRTDTVPPRYRYHRLFADLLRHTLHAREPESVQSAHRRAAEWFVEQGDVVAAEDHLVAAGEFLRAFQAMADDVAAHIEEGGIAEEPTPVVASGVPTPFVLDDPLRAYELAAALIVGGRAGEGELWLERLRLKEAGAEGAPWLRARAELLWALHAAVLGDADGALDRVAHFRRLSGSEGSPPEAPAPVRAAHPWMERVDRVAPSVAVVIAARALCWRGEHDAAARELSGVDGGSVQLASVVVPGLTAVIAVGQGRLADGHASAVSALDMAARLGRGTAAITFDAHLALGRLFLERADFAQADAHLSTAAALSRQAARPAWVVEVELDQARLLLAQRRLEESYALVARLQAAGAVALLPDHVARRLAVLDVRWRLAAGDAAGAREGLARLPAGDRTVSLAARADLCSGRPDRAVARLSGPQVPELPGEELERLVVQAQALLLNGWQQRARSALRLAVERARAERLARTFVEAGPDVGWLLQALTTRFPDPHLAGLLERVQAGNADHRPSTLVEGLTERERAVLDRLPTHLTQREIAQDLYVSLNTLKTHLKGLYRKLGATSRAEAVAAAREHGFL